MRGGQPCVSEAGREQLLPKIGTTAPGQTVPAGAAAAHNDAEVKSALPSASNHDFGGSSAASAGESEITPASAKRCRNFSQQQVRLVIVQHTWPQICL